MGGEEIIEYLRNNYSIKTKKEIINDLNTSWSYIQKLACLNKIKRGFNESKNDHKYSKLIDYNSPITLYWLGFILADGHMWRSQSIHINLSSKDKCHILKLDSYLGGIKKYEISTQIRVAITDKKTCKVLSKDFKLLSNKTKEPPILPDFLTRDQLFCIIIGFIDGDGTISKRGHIRIKCDKSWKFILEMFYEVLTGDRKSFKITNCGCSIIFISKLETLREIYIRAKNLNLPLMERKWDRLNTYTGSESRFYNKYKSVENLLNMGVIPSDIQKITNFSSSFIYKVKKSIQNTF